MQQIADREQLGGLLGTGVSLAALYEHDVDLKRALDWISVGRFDRALRAFFAREAAKNLPRLSRARLSRNCWNLFQFAVANQVGPNEQLEAEHVLLELAQGAETHTTKFNAHHILREADVSRQDFLALACAPRSVMPGFHPDHASGSAADDCLDLGASVSAMANLIASPDLEGNLSRRVRQLGFGQELLHAASAERDR
jgi:hypothetical protein